MQDDVLSYYELKNEYENYQISSELQMQKLSKKNMKLEKDINILANIVEISKYINTFISDENLISMINDMILGLLGVSYSTILLRENEEMIVKATNINDRKLYLTEEEKSYINEGKSYIINNERGIRIYKKSKINICSVMGMPIKLREKYCGFIIVEHKNYNFLNSDHDTFLKSIANQIAIGLENSMLYNQLQEAVKKDPFLGIYNRRYFFDFVEEKIKDNPAESYAIVMMDLDNFKKFNDLYGHQFGDKVLIETVKTVENQITENCVLARYGGEEIIIYISGFEEKSEVIKQVNDIRAAIENNIIDDGNIAKKITASIGIAFSDKHVDDINAVIKEADEFLYKAKAGGKNRVEYNMSI